MKAKTHWERQKDNDLETVYAGIVDGKEVGWISYEKRKGDCPYRAVYRGKFHCLRNHAWCSTLDEAKNAIDDWISKDTDAQ